MDAVQRKLANFESLTSVKYSGVDSLSRPALSTAHCVSGETFINN